ncbi:hypothetical protein ATG66_2934 [Vibrio sp. ES.051]|uniref:DUF2057 family protein n=1 Tax=Vibrio sp. ES.051 TaxID=1761909 RepID=UPI000BF9A728|nr:DUF2057 family protein [Vibrio sp. ES.051]PFG45850.1 hypothetical protein ATG66_2934 [Vibrio sp. ES.051]
MKLKTWLTLFAFAFMGTAVNAETTNEVKMSAVVTTAQGVEVLFVNGIAADEWNTPLTVTEGYNQLVVRVNKGIGRGDKRTQVKSAPYIIDLDLGAGKLYIDMPAFRKERQAEKLFEQDKMDWKVNLNGQSIKYTQYKMLGKKGAFPYSNLDEQLLEYNQANGIYFVNGSKVDLSTNELIEAGGVNHDNRQVTSSMTRAKIAYLEMSDTERQEFKKWIKQQ